MSDGHFYNCEESPYLTKATTPAQAKKVKAYPSCTTILSIQKSEFLDNIWSPRKLVELGRQYPLASVNEIQDMKYGFRISPVDGSSIRSSDFGTAVHKRLEEVINKFIDPAAKAEKRTPFDPWVKPFIDFMKENDVEPVACEKILYCDKMKSAGSVDLIAKVDGKYHLFDYKCRDTKGTGGKFYETKDCTQLAVESRWLAQTEGLDYDPMITSVCICTESRKHYHKNWSKSQMRKGVTRFRHLSKLYWMDWMKK